MQIVHAVTWKWRGVYGHYILVYTVLLTESWICPLTWCKIHVMCLPFSVSQHGLIDNTPSTKKINLHAKPKGWWWFNLTQEYYSLSHKTPLKVSGQSHVQVLKFSSPPFMQKMERLQSRTGKDRYKYAFVNIRYGYM